MKHLPTVRDFMVTKLKTLAPDQDIRDAIRFLLKHKISGAPVVGPGGELIGVLSELDCLRLLAKGVEAEMPVGPVRSFMSQEVETLPPNMDVYFAAGKFLQTRYRRFPVVEDGQLLGQVSRRDVLAAVSNMLDLGATSDL